METSDRPQGNEHSSLLSLKTRNTAYSPINHSVENDDDAVSSSVKTLVKRLTWVFSFWLVSYVIIMLQVIDKGHFIKWTSVLFTPMWVGSALGLYSVFSVMNKVCCCKLKLVSRDEKFFLRSQGRDVTSNYIDYESLPLLRRLFFWSCVTTICMVFTSLSQILFYLWLVEGIIGMWHALVPVMIFVVLILLYMFVVKTVSLLDCTAIFCLVIELVLFVTKCKNYHDLLWAEILIPLWITQVLWMGQLSFIGVQVYKGRYQLNERQLVCLLGYVAALVSTIWAQIITILAESDLMKGDEGSGTVSDPSNDDNEQVFSMSVLPEVLWLLSIVIFVSCALLILNMEAVRYADSRGHIDPLPLSRTTSGWQPAEECSQQTLLLGTIRVCARAPSARQNSRNNGSSAPSSAPQSSASGSVNSSNTTQKTTIQTLFRGNGSGGKTVAEKLTEIEFKDLQKRTSGDLEGGSEDF